jgi:plasmid stabilization system protein ParE
MGQEPRTLVWAATALEDLVGVLENVADHFPGIEHGLYEDVMAAAASLTTFSERGRLVPDFHGHRTREIFVRDYRLMYEVYDDRVVIVAIVFGRRDFATWRREREKS